jgi:hypothetical protein
LAVVVVVRGAGYLWVIPAIMAAQQEAEALQRMSTMFLFTLEKL